MPVSIDEALRYVRQNNVLEAWCDEDIKRQITLSSMNAALAFSTDGDGNLNGLCFGYWKDPETLHVYCLAGQYKKFMKYLKEVFPRAKKITGFRENKIKEYKIYGK